jgi:hypothetical protein
MAMLTYLTYPQRYVTTLSSSLEAQNGWVLRIGKRPPANYHCKLPVLKVVSPSYCNLYGLCH